jgi:nudix-type nucleoside diphosphatase (YffH/AdpP family)
MIDQTMDEDVELISRRRIFDDFLKVDEAEVRVGGEIQRRLSLERGDSAAALIQRREDGAILLTRQFRYPTLEHGPGFLLELPAGGIEDDEDPVVAMRRELVEELGYEADDLVPISTFYVSPGGSSERVHLFYAEVDASDRVGQGGGVPSEGEVIEIVTMGVDELLSRVADGTIADAKTIIGALWLQRRLDQR